MRSALILLSAAFCAQASDSFIDQLETRTSRFAVLTQMILFQIQDADNEQVKAFSIFAKDAGIHMNEFSLLLKRSHELIAEMGSKPSQKQLDELRGIAGKMDSVIDSMRKTKDEVDQITK